VVLLQRPLGLWRQACCNASVAAGPWSTRAVAPYVAAYVPPWDRTRADACSKQRADRRDSVARSAGRSAVVSTTSEGTQSGPEEAELAVRTTTVTQTCWWEGEGPSLNIAS
jgi:hypothetical protein